MIFKKKPSVTYRFSCGRAFLMVSGNAIVMEGDKIRDFDLSAKATELYEKKYKGGPHWDAMKSFPAGEVWSDDLIQFVVREANGGELIE